MDSPKPDLERLKGLFEAARIHVGPKREETFFSIGGRGYYENPASDLLSFFMTKGSHGLQAAFLGAFLEFIQPSVAEQLESMLHETIRVEREKRTEERNRLDLRIFGETWALVIENKIRHWVANPLDDYENSVRKLAGKRRKLYLMILSPSGESPAPEKWAPVTYRELVSRIRERMKAPGIPSDPSKWRVFAEDFLLHLEQDVSIHPMNPNEIKFVEEHLEDLPNIQRLQNDYMHHLWHRLHSELEANAIRGLSLKWESCYFLIRAENLADWQLGLSGPNHLNLGDEGKLVVRIWGNANHPDLGMARESYFPKYEEAGEDGQFREYRYCLGNSADAIAEILRLSKVLLPVDGEIVATQETIRN